MVKSIPTSKSELASAARSAEVPVGGDGSPNARSAFNSAAIGMSWQLAVVVLLPILGGYKIDQRAHMMPVWTLIGLLVATVGSILVVRRAMASFGDLTKPYTTPTDTSDDEDDA